MIDLHVHSTFSDGTLTPSELVIYANKLNLTAIALTDHDCIDGVGEAIEAAADTPLTVIPGIEISTRYNGHEIHMLGLNIDYMNSDFQTHINEFKHSRENRNAKMIEALKNQGFDIADEKLAVRFPDSIITRAHYAVWLVENGYVASKDDAFKKYLSPGCPCYFKKEVVSPEQAIKIIHDAGGKAIIAHPLLYHMSDTEVEILVSSMVTHGLDGIEAIYSCNKWTDESRMKALAQKYNLIISGGSDFHGANKPGLDLGTGYGKLNVPDEILKNIGDHS